MFGPVLFQHDNALVHKASIMKKCVSQFAVLELDWRAHIAELNLIQHFGMNWNADCWSVLDFTNVLVSEWEGFMLDSEYKLI